jgi:nitrogen-specific signal transduction histidine kinase
MGGSLELVSEPGRTVFTLSLPVEQGARAAQHARS